jgi:hypothetical protein
MREVTEESDARQEYPSLRELVDRGELDPSILEAVPVKLVTGEQITGRLSFTLAPGAIVAERGATVLFVCG